MRIKQLFVSLGIALTILGVNIFPGVTIATGVEDSILSDQEQDNQDDTAQDPTNGSSIGGGLNTDHDQPDLPLQPETPGVSEPLPQPEEPENEPQPEPEAPEPVRPNTPVATPQRPAAGYRPQTQPYHTVPEVVKETETTDSSAIPLAPSDNVAPTSAIDPPRTGLTESAPANPLAVALVILAGLTILTAGLASIGLSQAAKRSQTTF